MRYKDCKWRWVVHVVLYNRYLTDWEVEVLLEVSDCLVGHL